MEKMLVVGKGYLGERVVQHFGADGVDVDEIDITSLASVEACLEKYKPEVVVNMAAMTDTHGMEKPEALQISP